jgi:phenylacetate-CoA ligase
VSSLERIYASLPGPLQYLALQYEGARVRRRNFGGDFRLRLASYLANDRRSEEETVRLRGDRLRAALRRAVAAVPFWRERLASSGIDPVRVSDPRDLAAMPILTKDEVLRIGPALLRGRVEGPTYVAHTSGTTGAGLVFPMTFDGRRDQWAVWARYRLRHGIEPGTWHAWFGGRAVIPAGTTHGPYWRVSRPLRQVIYSQYHLGPRTEREYLQDLGRRGLPFLHGYPSTLSLLADAALRHGDLPGYRPRWVTTGAENLLEHQRDRIREAFGVLPRQNYGQTEAVASFSECPAGRLHVDEDFAAVEFVPAGDGACRIVGTSFCNDAFPLIRYDTGDLARLDGDGCDCGLPGRVVASIDGRQEDLVELSDGSKVGRLDHLFKDMVRVAEAQIRQQRAGAVTIAIVPRAGWSKADEKELLDECRDRFGERLKVEVELVEAIPKSKSGKLRLVVRQ